MRMRMVYTTRIKHLNALWAQFLINQNYALCICGGKSGDVNLAIIEK